MANFFLLLGIGFTINFCLIRRYVLRWLNLSGVLHLVLHQYMCSDSGHFHIDLLNNLVNTPVSAMGSIRKFITNEQLLLLVPQLSRLRFIYWKYFFNFLLFTGIDPKISKTSKIPCIMDFLKKHVDFEIMKKLIHSCTFPSNDTLSQRNG